jgi:hypothetical protein
MDVLSSDDVIPLDSAWMADHERAAIDIDGEQ